MAVYNSTFAGQKAIPAGAEARVGYAAPSFTLETVDRTPFDLADYRERSHVVLVFGNIT